MSPFSTSQNKYNQNAGQLDAETLAYLDRSLQYFKDLQFNQKSDRYRSHSDLRKEDLYSHQQKSSIADYLNLQKVTWLDNLISSNQIQLFRLFPFDLMITRRSCAQTPPKESGKKWFPLVTKRGPINKSIIAKDSHDFHPWPRLSP